MCSQGCCQVTRHPLCVTPPQPDSCPRDTVRKGILSLSLSSHPVESLELRAHWRHCPASAWQRPRGLTEFLANIQVFLRLGSEPHSTLSPGDLHLPSPPLPLPMLQLLSASPHLEQGRLSPTMLTGLLLYASQGLLLFQLRIFVKIGTDSQWSLG